MVITSNHVQLWPFVIQFSLPCTEVELHILSYLKESELNNVALLSKVHVVHCLSNIFKWTVCNLMSSFFQHHKQLAGKHFLFLYHITVLKFLSGTPCVTPKQKKHEKQNQVWCCSWRITIVATQMMTSCGAAYMAPSGAQGRSNALQHPRMIPLGKIFL